MLRHQPGGFVLPGLGRRLRVLPFDADAARICADIVATDRLAGQ
jgi:hypothetical protein